MKRKCPSCKKEEVITKDNIDNFIRFENSCYHYDCFVDVCKRRSKRSNALPKWGEALASLDKIKQESREFLMNELYKDDIFQFIKENYSVSVVPSRIFTKLSDIYNGTYKGLTRCIPPEDILDMWQQKMNFLIKTKMKNIASGKEMSEADQINYDISVLINMYDKYLKWKEQNKILSQQDNKVDIDILKTVNLDKLSKIAQTQSQKDEDDMDSLLDELFD